MKKYDIILVDLNPVKGSEQVWVRPCLIIQNDFANTFARTFVVAIVSSVIKEYPHTYIISPDDHNGLTENSRIDFLQVRTIDQERIIRKIGSCAESDRQKIDEVIKRSFALN
jgi:mRNA interferase MazF